MRPDGYFNGLVGWENLKTGNPWVFIMKLIGLSGENVPIIQFYEYLVPFKGGHLTSVSGVVAPCGTHQPTSETTDVLLGMIHPAVMKNCFSPATNCSTVLYYRPSRQNVSFPHGEAA